MVYGYYFYPLYAIAVEQLFRIVDAAIFHKCKEMGSPNSIKTLEKRIDWLLEKNAITKEEFDRLHVARQARNIASHPESQMILPPGPAIGILTNIAKIINIIYK